MKRKILISVLMLIIISFAVVSADFSAQKGYDWLVAQGDKGFGNNIQAISFAIMALDSAGYDTEGYSSLLYDNMGDNCWPSSSCTTKDTAISVLALNNLQDDSYFELVDEWYEDALQGGSFTGEWLLEIATSSSGKCILSYEVANQTIEKEIEVNNGQFPSCGNSNFLNLDTCIQTNLIKNNPGLLIEADCSDVEGDVIMTLLYKSATTYYLLDNQNTNVGEFTVNNGCFSTGESGSCNKESSLYSSWALNKIGSSTNSLIYLKENYDASSTLDNAILFFITGDKGYLGVLEDYQKTDGSFDRNVFRTAIAVLALNEYPSDYAEEIDKAKTWLREQQNDDGNWNSNVEDTAITLYAVFSDEEVVPSEIEEPEVIAEEDECTYDEDCLDVYGEGYECFGGQCTYVGGVGECEINEDCDNGEICEDGVCVPEQTENISPECITDDDCDSDETCTASGNCISKPEEEKGGWGWIIAVIIVIVIIVALFFFYKKGYLGPLSNILNKMRGKGPSNYRPPMMPSPGMRPPMQQQPLQRSIQQARQQFRK